MSYSGLRISRLITVLIVIALLTALIGWAYPAKSAHASRPAAVPVGPFVWNVAFYNNATLTGSPSITRQDYYVGGNWGTGSPGLGIPVDYFSARWTTTAYLTGGTYQFMFLADDGVKLIVDGAQLLNTIDAPRPGEVLVVQYTTTAGNHTIQIDYRENTLTAYLSFSWDQTSSTPPAPTPIPTPSGPPVGTVNTTGLNVHAGPNYSYNVVELAFQGWTMTLLGRSSTSTWLKVRTPTGKIGWVEVAHITSGYPVAALPLADGTTPPTTVTPPTTYPPTGARTYTVQRGDTLFRIALRFGVNMYTLASVNGILNLNLIYAGQVLIIP